MKGYNRVLEENFQENVCSRLGEIKKEAGITLQKLQGSINRGGREISRLTLRRNQSNRSRSHER